MLRAALLLATASAGLALVDPWENYIPGDPSTDLPTLPTAYTATAVYKNDQVEQASSKLLLVVGNHGYNDFPSEKFYAWKVTTLLGAINATDVAVSFQERVGGYAYHTFTDEEGRSQCSSGTETPAASLLDFSWLTNKAVTVAGNITVTLPGQSHPTRCVSYQESDDPHHSVCCVPLEGALSATGKPMRPLLHRNGDAKLYFLDLAAQQANSLEPSNPQFAPPPGCATPTPTDKDDGITWQILLGACVGSLVLGMGLTGLVVYCRGRKSGEEEHQAFEAALLDVM